MIAVLTNLPFSDPGSGGEERHPDLPVTRL